MDTKPTEIHATEEMEEAHKVSKNDDILWLQAPGSSLSLDQDEQMAISGKERGTFRNESQVVQKAGTDPFACVYATNS